ncbi:MAG: DUF1844 domain-containing protein [Deltaproteobacteria bacterium]|nr:DUF1844 domain-containing protein [Deltaproteobacteria bacterium]
MSDFVVNDRRSFDRDGNLNEEKKPEESQAQTSQRSEKGAENTYDLEGTASEELLPVSISTLFIGLATSALYNLGGGGDQKSQDAKPPEINLAEAKHYIDLLGILEQKTRGNLTSAEEELLKAFLRDLRLHYVSLVNK